MRPLLLAVAGLIGTSAPDFSLFTPDGRAWRLSEMLVDRPVVLFHATGCEETVAVPDSIRLVALRPSICGGYRDHTGAARRFLGEAKAALIDKSRIVRLTSSSDLRQFAADVAQWSTAPKSDDRQRCLLCHTSIPAPEAKVP
jgi:hypothetical protein